MATIINPKDLTTDERGRLQQVIAQAVAGSQRTYGEIFTPGFLQDVEGRLGTRVTAGTDISGRPVSEYTTTGLRGRNWEERVNPAVWLGEAIFGGGRESGTVGRAPLRGSQGLLESQVAGSLNEVLDSGEPFDLERIFNPEIITEVLPQVPGASRTIAQAQRATTPGTRVEGRNRFLTNEELEAEVEVPAGVEGEVVAEVTSGGGGLGGSFSDQNLYRRNQAYLREMSLYDQEVLNAMNNPDIQARVPQPSPQRFFASRYPGYSDARDFDRLAREMPGDRQENEARIRQEYTEWAQAEEQASAERLRQVAVAAVDSQRANENRPTSAQIQSGIARTQADPEALAEAEARALQGIPEAQIEPETPTIPSAILADLTRERRLLAETGQASEYLGVLEDLISSGVPLTNSGPVSDNPRDWENWAAARAMRPGGAIDQSRSRVGMSAQAEAPLPQQQYDRRLIRDENNVFRPAVPRDVSQMEVADVSPERIRALMESRPLRGADPAEYREEIDILDPVTGQATQSFAGGVGEVPVIDNQPVQPVAPPIQRTSEATSPASSRVSALASAQFPDVVEPPASQVMIDGLYGTNRPAVPSEVTRVNLPMPTEPRPEVTRVNLPMPAEPRPAGPMGTAIQSNRSPESRRYWNLQRQPI